MDETQHRFTALVRAWSADLYRYAYWLCRNRAQAEDLVQEAFLRAWRSLANLRDGDSAKGWLLTIVRREFLRRLDGTTTVDADTELVDVPGTSGDGLEAWLVRRALHELPLEYREPLLLQVLGGYRCEEIATLLEISPGAVMTRLFRARQKLRNRLAHDTATDTLAEPSYELP